MDTQENSQIPEKSAADKISKDKLQELTTLVKSNFNSFMATLPPESKKILKIAVGAVAFLLVLLILTSLVNGVRTITLRKVPSPSPRAYATPSLEEITTPSRYAKDEGILKIKSGLDGIDKDLGSIDIKETNLSLPRIDFAIKFEK